MKYIIFSANYNSNTGLIDEYSSKELSFAELKIHTQLQTQIQNWLHSYNKIIPLSEKQKKEQIDLINALDKEGLLIIKAILKVNKNLKIKYYSEGYLKYIYF